MSTTDHPFHSQPLPTDGSAWIARLPRVHGIDPVDGWHLLVLRDSESHWDPSEYAAARPDQVVLLGVSRWRFTPSQARFEWLVRNGFPSMAKRLGGCATPLDDEDIDAALAGERLAA